METFDWTKLIAPAIGAVVASQGGSKQTKPTVTTVNPYAPAQPHINAALEQAAKIYQQNASMPPWLQDLYNSGLGTYKAIGQMPMPQRTTAANLGLSSTPSQGLDWNFIKGALDYRGGQ